MPKDYNDASKTQKIDMLDVANSRNIFLNYDFREVWERTFFIKVAENLRNNELESPFTRFALGERTRLSSIFDGVLRSSKIKLSADLEYIKGHVDIDLSKLEGKEVQISDYLTICRDLIVKFHYTHRCYLFVDELVFSKLDSRDDEIRIRAAMVRDIFRVCRSFNNFFVKNELDFHVVASVRPEIRDLINDLDAEIGKIFDGKSAHLTWDMSEGEDSLLVMLLKQKIIHSKGNSSVNFSEFFDMSFDFAGKIVSISEFINTNTWCRPRDIIQLLNCIAEKNQNSERIGSVEIKNSLNEYSRRVMSEIMEEVSVRHGQTISSHLRDLVDRKEYKNFDDFNRRVISRIEVENKSNLIVDLFNYGVIGNFTDKFNKRRYYWAHRGEEYLRKDYGISIHNGLWNYFNER